jgi:glycosyltransferase involved in cell wall biosynthesis
MPRTEPAHVPDSKLVVMSFHPVTAEFSRHIETIYGPVCLYFDAANLRKMPLRAGIRELRKIRAGKLVIALEKDAARALIEPLSIAASFTRAKSIEVVWPDLRIDPVSRVGMLQRLAKVAWDTFASRRSLVRVMRSGLELKKTLMPRSVLPANGSRILYLDANMSLGTAVGGSIGHTAGVIEGFLEHRFEVDYASLKPMPTEKRGARFLALQPKTMLAIPPELNFYRYAETIETKIVPLHRSRPWSFIYQRFSLHNFSGPLLGRKLNIPVVVEFNGSEAWVAENWGTRLALHDQALEAETAALAAADLIVTVSDELAHDLRRRAIPDDRIVVYPNCVDPASFSPQRFAADELAALRDRYGIPRDALVAGFIGTFGQWHGVEFLAQCVRDMIEHDIGWIEQNKLHFMLVGDGLKMPIVRELLGPTPISRYVTLTGLVPQHEAAKHLACADLLVSPHVPNSDGSNFFGSPTKLFEYMAMEKPIVASALGQIGDVIAGRGATRLGLMPPGAGAMCGFLFEPGNEVDFKNTLHQVVDDMPSAIEVAKKARAEVLSRYTWNRHVAAILDRMCHNGLLTHLPDRLVA